MGNQEIHQIGILSERVIELTGIPLESGTPILVGEENISHMRREHPENFKLYGDRISEIISSPTYIAKHPAKDAIEYVKVFEINNDHVLVAVRASGKGVLFARTLFVMADEKILKYFSKNAFKNY